MATAMKATGMGMAAAKVMATTTPIKQQSTRSGIKRNCSGSDGNGNNGTTATATAKVTAGGGVGNNTAIAAMASAMAVMVAGF